MLFVRQNFTLTQCYFHYLHRLDGSVGFDASLPHFGARRRAFESRVSSLLHDRRLWLGLGAGLEMVWRRSVAVSNLVWDLTGPFLQTKIPDLVELVWKWPQTRFLDHSRPSQVVALLLMEIAWHIKSFTLCNYRGALYAPGVLSRIFFPLQVVKEVSLAHVEWTRISSDERAALIHMLALPSIVRMSVLQNTFSTHAEFAQCVGCASGVTDVSIIAPRVFVDGHPGALSWDAPATRPSPLRMTILVGQDSANARNDLHLAVAVVDLFDLRRLKSLEVTWQSAAEGSSRELQTLLNATISVTELNLKAHPEIQGKVDPYPASRCSPGSSGRPHALALTACAPPQLGHALYVDSSDDPKVSAVASAPYFGVSMGIHRERRW